MEILNNKQVYYLILLHLLFCIFLNSDQSMLIIDKSVSMSGFFKTGSLRKIYEGICTELKKSSSFSETMLFGFNTKGLIQYKSFNEIVPKGDTLIDKALKDPTVQSFMDTFKAQVLSVESIDKRIREKK